MTLKTVDRPLVARATAVAKSYRSKRLTIQALSEVDLQIRAGEFVSVVGPSGCGKSTLLKIVAGLSQRSAGELEVLGRPVTGPVTELGIVFQQHLLLPWRTILQNVLLQMEIRSQNGAEAKARAVTLLDSVGLGDFIDRFPDELSGGMKQRASIVRAMVHDPELILMDEPFGALDAMTRDQMTLDFHALSRDEGKTVLFVTHSIDEAVFLSDRVIVMSPRPGRIVAEIKIDLPSHRTLELRDEPEFAAYAKQIRALFQGMGILRERKAS
jgi:NitT/TauT family transport system ATP-binding protein